MARLLPSALLFAALTAFALAKSGHFNCADIECEYCATARLKADCKDHCKNACGYSGTTTPPTPTMTPDQKFSTCCKRKLDQGAISDARCLDFCTFPNLNKQKLVNAYLTGACKGSQAAEVFYCASAGKEQKSCCASHNSPQKYTGRLAMCINLCDPNAPQSTDPKLLPCLDNLSPMRDCYRSHVATLADSDF